MGKLILFFVVILIGWAIFTLIRDSRRVEVNRYKVPVGKGKISEPITLVHISDIHIAPWFLPEKFSSYADYISKIGADYVVITGDLVTHYRELIPDMAEYISKIKSKKGTIAVSGNHDFWTDAEYMELCLEDKKVVILHNQAMFDRRGINFVGIEDAFTHHHDLNKAFSEVTEEGVSILLSHSPDVIWDAPRYKPDVILAGHTHGGQVRLPILGSIYVPSMFGKKYDQGWFIEDGICMYVNRGLGGVFPPIRFLCPREIAILEFVPEDGSPTLISKENIYP